MYISNDFLSARTSIKAPKPSGINIAIPIKLLHLLFSTRAQPLKSLGWSKRCTVISVIHRVIRSWANQPNTFQIIELHFSVKATRNCRSIRRQSQVWLMSDNNCKAVHVRHWKVILLSCRQCITHKIAMFRTVSIRNGQLSQQVSPNSICWNFTLCKELFSAVRSVYGTLQSLLRYSNPVFVVDVVLRYRSQLQSRSYKTLFVLR